MPNLKRTVLIAAFLSVAFSCCGLNNQVTICIPTYNAQRTLKACVEHAAQYGHYQFLIYDNGSLDQTRDVITELAKSNAIRTKVVPHKRVFDRDDKSFNAGRVRAALANDVKTQYLFFLDSDVMLSAPIDPLINELTGEVGMVGYRYSESSHLQTGATLLKTALARRIDWNKESLCNCLNAKHQLDELGLRTLIIEGIKLKHDK
jgi:glycosyltransferase involved in cell wall biosynthesis